MSEVPAHVDDAEVLHRILNARTNAIGADGNVHYMAFYSSTNPWRISVDRARYRSTAATLLGRPDWRLAKLITAGVRALPVDPSLRVDGLPENGNDAHAEIVAAPQISKKQMKTRICVQLAEIASLVNHDGT